MRAYVPVVRQVPLRDHLRGYWDDMARATSEVCLDRLEQAVEILLACQETGRVVFAIGNGGSAATASHFACDLAKGTRRDGPPTFRVVSLTDCVPLLTAWANDNGYERVFAEQLDALASGGDVLVAISASGNSPNVLAAVDAAHARGMTVIALTGRSGGMLAARADLVVHVPSDRIEVVEDAHQIMAHSLCVAARERLAERAARHGRTTLRVVSARRPAR